MPLGRSRSRSTRMSHTAWHFNHTTSPSGNVTDFYSVAIHELAHALGFGSQSRARTEWESLCQRLDFLTAATPRCKTVATGAAVGRRAHWANGTHECGLRQIDGAGSGDGSRCAERHAQAVHGPRCRRADGHWLGALLRHRRRHRSATTTTTASSMRPTTSCGGTRLNQSVTIAQRCDARHGDGGGLHSVAEQFCDAHGGSGSGSAAAGGGAGTGRRAHCLADCSAAV